MEVIVQSLLPHRDDKLQKKLERLCETTFAAYRPCYCEARNIDCLFNLETKLEGILPKPLISILSEYASSRGVYCHFNLSHACRLAFVRDPVFRARNLSFSRKDTVFRRDFAHWIQNDERAVECMLDLSKMDMVVQYEYSTLKLTHLYVCEHCMKRKLQAHGTNYPFYRKYKACRLESYDLEALPRYVRKSWCQKCKRVPLFHILTKPEYEVEYGPLEQLTDHILSRGFIEEMAFREIKVEWHM